MFIEQAQEPELPQHNGGHGRVHVTRPCVPPRPPAVEAEIVGAIEGHTYAQRLRAPERGRLLLRVAEMAQRFHQAGFVHKDYYVGHVLVRSTSGQPELFLIDLVDYLRLTDD